MNHPKTVSRDLKPFSRTQSPIELKVDLNRSREGLLVTYFLTSPLGFLSIADQRSQVSRADKLWENTCFELFFGETGKAHYWELNLSPDLRWNLYRFTSYREGMAQEERISELDPPEHQQSVQKNEVKLLLRIKIPLVPLHLEAAPLDISATAVLRESSGATQYWALAHCASQPDFHNRSSFVEKLSSQ